MIKEITIISTLPPIKGISPYTVGLVEELCKNIKIHFLGFNKIYPRFAYPGDICDYSQKTIESNDNLIIRNVLNWYNPIQWIIEAFRIKTKIIHAQWWSWFLAPMYWFILGINRLRGKKIILTIHNVIPHEKNKIKIWLNKSVYKYANEFIVHTERSKIDLMKITNNKKKIYTLPIGLTIPVLTNLTKEDARKRLNITNDKKILLCFGNIRDYKGVDVAIKSLSLIKDEKVVLMIVGQCWGKWDKYQKIIDEYKLNDRIILNLDFIPSDSIEQIFKASDLALLPYKHFDAASAVGSLVLPYEIPMIVSDVGGLPDLVEDDNCIFEPEKVEQLKERICNILNNKELYNKILNDIKFTKNKYLWSNIALKTMETYI